jgi:hypothetical protein
MIPSPSSSGSRNPFYPWPQIVLAERWCTSDTLVIMYFYNLKHISSCVFLALLVEGERHSGDLTFNTVIQVLVISETWKLKFVHNIEECFRKLQAMQRFQVSLSEYKDGGCCLFNNTKEIQSPMCI